MSAFKDLTGQTFGRMYVDGRAPDGVRSNGKPMIQWYCHCTECGYKVILNASKLSATKKTNSGCNKCRGKDTARRETKHGLINHPLYGKYHDIRQRCENPNCDHYHNYGGRGIKICDEWSGKDGFINFYNWSISHGWSKGLEIDRIDVNGNYCPENCRYITHKEQYRNKQSTRKLIYNGEERTIQELSRISGVSASEIYYRVKNGWSVEYAVNVRSSHSNNRLYKIVMEDLKTHSVIKEFDGIKDAVEYLKNICGKSIYGNGHIDDVCRKQRNSAFGYYWEYKENVSYGIKKG